MSNIAQHIVIVEVGWWEHWASLLHFYFYVYLNITINNYFKLKINALHKESIEIHHIVTDYPGSGRRVEE